ncbi:hypothetical protein BD779DRAFT_1504313 [Infundibulicybe gibba]|nr:hypothetical protein BD779DRAFT_1504313 [Infundibulicybe gibba]
MSEVRIAIVAAGAMGSAVGRKLTDAGCVVLTNLDGRSEETRRRAREAGMRDTSFRDMVQQAHIFMSILPPRDARTLAQKVVAAQEAGGDARPFIFADCNAVNPVSVKDIGELFSGTSIQFVDACIIGGPPSDGYDPTFYASVGHGAGASLEEFVALTRFGLKITPLRGDGSGIGAASALKMSYAGISKGIIGLFATMILAASRSSPATADALIHELRASQPGLLQRLTQTVPPMLPKAYRFVGEMKEIAGFVGGDEGETYEGLSKLYENIAGNKGDEHEL